MVYDKSKPSVNFAENEHKKARERNAAEKAAKAAKTAQQAADAAEAEQRTYEASPKTDRD